MEVGLISPVFLLIVVLVCILIWAVIQARKKDQISVDTAPTNPKNSDNHNHGFSYVVVMKIINAIVSIVIGLFLAGTAKNTLGMEDSTTILAWIVIAVLSYWILTLPIKLFENIAIIAKNTTDIRNKLYK